MPTRNGKRYELTKRELAFRGIVATLAGVVLLGLIALNTRGYFGGPAKVSAQVSNAGGSLRPGADVKVQGVLVGKVLKVATGQNGKVDVDLGIQGDQLNGVPSNVQARILPATVFGTSYVDLVPTGRGTGSALAVGARIPEDQSVGTIELQSALDDIDKITKALGPAELASALGSAARALDGNGGQLGEMIDQLDALLKTVEPSMPLIRTDISKLADNLDLIQRTAPDLLTAVDDSLSTIRTITVEKATIASILTGGTRLAKDAQSLLANNQAALVRYLHNAATVLDALYDNRVAAFNGAMGTNRRVAAGIRSTISHGFVDTTAKIRPATTPAPGFYGSGDCPDYGGARGDNCPGGRLGKASVSSMFGGGAR